MEWVGVVAFSNCYIVIYVVHVKLTLYTHT